jgi:hypothetical protein
MFQLMFRAERLDHTRPILNEASKAAFAKLAGIVAAQRHEDIALDHLTIEQAADVARIWSQVHGFAMLYLDGRLQHILDATPGVTAEELRGDAEADARLPIGNRSRRHALSTHGTSAPDSMET